MLFVMYADGPTLKFAFSSAIKEKAKTNLHNNFQKYAKK